MHVERASVMLQQTSERVNSTDDPVIVKTKQLMSGTEGVISLAQGSLLPTVINGYHAPLHPNHLVDASPSPSLITAILESP